MRKTVRVLFLLLLWGISMAGTDPGSIANAQEVLLSEDFSTAAQGALPEGWSQLTGEDGAAYVDNGHLIIDGTAANYTPTSVILPDSLKDYGNYRIDAQLTIESANTSTRWIGLQFLVGDGGMPFYQMCIRKDATASNGTEGAYASDDWVILTRSPYTQEISSDKTYTVTIIVYNGRAYQYINGTLLQDYELSQGQPNGTVALQAAGAVMKMDSIQVTEQTQKPDLTGLLLDETFENVENGSLPDGWSQTTGVDGAVYVEDGSLYVDGRANNYTATAVDLPDELFGYGNYRIDASFTITQSNTTSRWVSVKYRLDQSGEPYHQMAIRQKATASNGTELAYRNNSSWNVMLKSAFSESISADSTYNLTVIVYEDQVKQYLNGKLMQEGELYEDTVVGGIGVQAAGAVLKLDFIKVTEQTDPIDGSVKIFDVNAPVTDLAMAPTFIQPIDSLDETTTTQAGSALMFLDHDLGMTNAAGVDLGNAQDLLADEALTVLPVFYISDTVTAEALSALADTQNTYDFTVISSDPELVAYARWLMPLARGAVDFTQTALSGDNDELLDIIHKTNQGRSKIAVLPASILTKARVNYLQRMMITVWGCVDSLSSEPGSTVSSTRAARMLVSGVNGIVTRSLDTFTDILFQLKSDTLLRRSIVVGHRGIPSVYPENTLEGAIYAYEQGAQAIECDIYLTTDDQIVVMHDATVNRTTDGTGNIEEMSLEQVKALTIDDDVYTGLKVPTMEEYFARFLGEPVTHFIEIKSSQTAIVQKLKDLIDAYEVADQVVVIAFSDAQLEEMGEIMPEVSVGSLSSYTATSRVNSNIRAILQQIQPLSAVFSPSYGGVTSNLLEAGNPRGMTLWGWTYTRQSDLFNYYAMGMHGLTTNYVQWAKQFPVQIETPSRPISAVSGTVVSTSADIQLQDRTTMTVSDFSMVVLNSTASYNNEDGELIFTNAGSANIMLGYTYSMDDGTHFTIYSDPVKVVVKKASRSRSRKVRSRN